MKIVGKITCGLISSVMILGTVSASLNLDIQLITHNIPNSNQDTDFRLCLQPAQPYSKGSTCPYGEFVVPSNWGTPHTTKTLMKEEASSRQAVLFTNFWPTGEFQLLIESLRSPGLRGEKLTDAIIIPFKKNLPIMNKPSPVEVYSGKSHALSLRYRISSDCDAGMYGRDCQLTCAPPKDFGECEPICSYLGEVVCSMSSSIDVTAQDGSIERDQRAADQQTQNDGLPINTLIIVVVVSVFGGYLIILGLIVSIFVFCFVRCVDGKPKLTRKQRIKCPQRLSNGLDMICSDGKFCCCEMEVCDNGELMFWTEIAILVIVCFPFAVCFLVLWGVASGR